MEYDDLIDPQQSGETAGLTLKTYHGLIQFYLQRYRPTCQRNFVAQCASGNQGHCTDIGSCFCKHELKTDDICLCQIKANN